MAAALQAPVAALPPSVNLDAYVARIGYTGAHVPTLATLCALAERQPARIPFEAIDVRLGRGVDLDPAAVDAKLLHAGRGGYCFEQNGLLRRVLLALGFEVTGLAARVRWLLADDAPPTPRTHMVLKVIVDGEAWLVDAGFGSCTPTTPLNLRSRAAQRSAHEAYRFVDGSHGTLLQARIDEHWVPVYEFTEEPQLDADYALYNWHTSTHPQSHFRHQLIVARVTSEARYALRDATLSVRRSGGELSRHRLDADGIEQALAEVFGLRVEPSWRAMIERTATGERQ
ncbi:arylamine N-acetyltransferase family protein [Sinimarinibacterium flocculans]|uniref:N-hydroxyarylamine O-acetyltransferase n=1 Tax=Sinimarinibacterium flocculans TaxID=985250 RepID=A0A318E6I1_9GAMM|nr:arylamine N-acetyltransferase [Sinimarinibacterium flocculans]PXV64654.1 N-hydroxyarylamine O-acetyltransferase [Sinimarinibacterium flocculans]